MRLFRVFIIVILSLILLQARPALALDINISNIRIGDFGRGTAKITWYTNVPSRSIVYYGLDANKLDQVLDYLSYEYQHDATLTNINKDKTYYYKIIAFDNQGNRIETYLLSFSSKGVQDILVTPEISNGKILQTTYNAAALSWQTSAPSNATIYYYYIDKNHAKKTSYSSYKTDHYIYLYNLVPYKNYTAEIYVKTKSGGQTSTVLTFRSGEAPANRPGLSINNIQPLSQNNSSVQATSATLSWQTNYVASSNIWYGTKPGKYGKKITVASLPTFDHQIILKDLKPQTTYYYKIEAHGSLFGYKTNSTEQSFTTRPLGQVLGEKITSDDQDGDGLSDSKEKELSTNPKTIDSDNDGYDDNTELKNNFNPLGYGRNKKQMSATLTDGHSAESKALKYLQNKYPNIKLDRDYWLTLTNAYLYGKYPLNAIERSIIYHGKTVHPNIPWSQWQKSADYINYISK